MNIGIVGLGLIGGSLGLRLQKRNHTVFGVVNNEINKKKASERNLANFISCDSKILSECSLVILALPIRDLINPSENLRNAIPQEAVVTDVGSIKEPIIEIWEKIHPLFIGSHPMAGSEEKGVDSGYESLLENAKWIITPTTKTNIRSKEYLTKFINDLDCELIETSPQEHDEAVSFISHLPIFLASSLIETANVDNNKSLIYLTQKLASTGFADTSRVGGGNPKLGVDLAINNQANLLKALKIFRSNIDELEDIIRSKNWDLLFRKLSKSKELRKSFLN